MIGFILYFNLMLVRFGMPQFGDMSDKYVYNMAVGYHNGHK